MTEHKLLDLFSGIGGFSLAADKFGIETIGFVEKDEFCQKILKKHWKNVSIESDIRNVKGDNYGSATIVSGGFPCQPFSVAGKRKGTDDDRYLWDETIRVVTECKPRWFIGENVDGLVNIQNGMVLRQVQDDLEKEGFQVQCLVIPASGVGAWHQRKRVWIIAYSDSNCKSDLTKYGQERSRKLGESHVSDTQHNGLYRPKGDATIKSSNQSEEWVSIGDDKHVSDTNHSRFQNRTEQCEGQSTSSQQRESSISRQSSVSDSESWWQTQSELCGVPDGVSYELHKDRTNRIKALGNSIVPQIAEQLFKSIIYAEQ